MEADCGRIWPSITKEKETPPGISAGAPEESTQGMEEDDDDDGGTLNNDEGLEQYAVQCPHRAPMTGN
jgi:hypothetical protein